MTKPAVPPVSVVSRDAPSHDTSRPDVSSPDASRPDVPLTGVVLAGGLSSRMGLDKRALCLHGEKDMLERTIDLLTACTTRVVVSCREDSLPDCVRAGRVPHVLDTLPDAPLAAAQTTPEHAEAAAAAGKVGPLAGMYACLKALGGPLLVLSCDLPFMTETVLRRLIDARNAAAPPPLMTTFRQAETGFIEALVAIYEAESLPYFERALIAGVRKLNVVIPEDRRCDVVYTHREAMPFFNVNYPADLELARQVRMEHP